MSCSLELSSTGVCRMLIICLITDLSFCTSMKFSCVESEKQALLRFKQDLIDPRDQLSSWGADKEDCCKLDGVVCDNTTGYVTELHLQNVNQFARLGGNLSSSLLDLNHLTYLDLSYNAFGGIEIPDFVGHMKNLRYLDLYLAGFGGMVPPQIGNISNLQYLSISDRLLHSDNVKWLSGLTSLEYLDLSFVDLSHAADSLMAISMLPALSELYLSSCELDYLPDLRRMNLSTLSALDMLDLHRNKLRRKSSSEIGNLTSLTELDLSFNNLDGPIPAYLGNLCKLKTLSLEANQFGGKIEEVFNSLSGCASNILASLDLAWNNFNGTLTDELLKFRNLSFISLDRNSIAGPIPSSVFVRLSSLRIFDVSYNQLNGTLPESLGGLSSLEVFDISHNFLEGVVSETHFVNLSSLKYFRASRNNLHLKVSPDWIPPFLLVQLEPREWHLGPKFPIWLKSQKDIERLDISATHISDTMPTWFWNLSSNIAFLNLSFNQIGGEIPYMNRTEVREIKNIFKELLHYSREL